MPKCTPPPLDLKIVERRLDELRVEGRAVRRHNAAQIEAIATSIRQFGFLDPLLIDETDAVIVGKARLAAARVAGLATVPTIQANHLSPAEKRAYRLAANKLCEIAGYDRDELALEFQELSELDLDFRLEITGFSTPEIEALVFGDDALGEDEAPIAEGPAVSELGDLWILGRHKLLCADSTDPQSYQKLLGDELVAGVFTDQPYNVKVNGHVRTGTGHREFAMASGEMSNDAFAEFLVSTLGLMAERCRPGAILYACMDWRHAGGMLAAAKANRLDLLNICVWNKGQGGMGSFYRSQHELVFVLKRAGAAHANFVALGKNGRNRTNVWDYPGANASAEGRADLSRHPTPKPIAMVADALLDATRPRELVLDPFCGGGTTLVAAERVDRCARAIELDPLYVDAAVRRWEAETGQNARCARTGLTFTERGDRAQALPAQALSIRQRQRKEAADV